MVPAFADKTSLSPADLQPANSKYIQYTGRVDFSDPQLPRFWSPGVYIQANFTGTYCNVELNDEVLWGASHNWIEIVVDDRPPIRVQTTGPRNMIVAGVGLPNGIHHITVCKDTEAGIGYLEFVGFHCQSLVKPNKLPRRRIEFIGDSITCGADADASTVPCGQGQWYDQHNAYLAYGPVTARELDSQWELTSVSGIGMYHSCCGNKITMPQVFDHLNIGDQTSPEWDFARYQPDVVTICLGQNDGSGDPADYQLAYIDFIEHLRKVYPRAEILCLTSPMADDNLSKFMHDNLQTIVQNINQQGDKRVHMFVLTGHHNNGCATHPDIAQHQQIADELASEIKQLMHW